MTGINISEAEVQKWHQNRKLSHVKMHNFEVRRGEAKQLRQQQKLNYWKTCQAFSSLLEKAWHSLTLSGIQKPDDF